MATNPEIINPLNHPPNQNNPPGVAQPFQENLPNQNLGLPPQYQAMFVNSSHQILTIRLNDTNYLVWPQQVIAGVKGYGLEGFLFGNIPKPTEFFLGTPPIPNPEFLIWQRKDQLRVSWLLAFISDNLLVTIIGLHSSNQI